MVVTLYEIRRLARRYFRGSLLISSSAGHAPGTGRPAVGDKVIPTARKPEDLKDLSATYGDNIRAVKLDVTSPRRRQERRVRRRVLEAPGVRVSDKAEAMLKSQKSMITWKAIPIFCMRYRQIPEITEVIPEAELVKLCSVEQHFNHIDETLPHGSGAELADHQ